MEANKASNTILEDLSSLLGAALPLLQILAIYLPRELKTIYLDPAHFPGVSVITLVFSYVAIIAYNSKPYFMVNLPFQAKKQADFNEYHRRIQEASSAKAFVAGEQATEAKIDKFIQEQRLETQKPPLQISWQNINSIAIVTLFVSGILFLVLGQLKSTTVAIIVQSVAYIVAVVSAVLVLTVYRYNLANNRQHQEDQKVRRQRAVDLAIGSNAFILLPQVKYIASYDDNNFPNNYHVWVKYQGEMYEIITDYRGTILHNVRPHGRV